MHGMKCASELHDRFYLVTVPWRLACIQGGALHQLYSLAFRWSA